MSEDLLTSFTNDSTAAPQDPEEVVEGSEVVNLSNSSVGTVRAELVRMNQSGAQKIIASEIDIQQSAALKIEAKDVTLTDSIAGTVESVNLNLDQSMAGLVRSEEIKIEQSNAGIVVADRASLNTANAAVLVARDIQADQIKTTFLFSGNVNGPVETAFDTPRAMLAGLTAGVAVGLVIFVSKLLDRSNNP